MVGSEEEVHYIVIFVQDKQKLPSLCRGESP